MARVRLLAAVVTVVVVIALLLACSSAEAKKCVTRLNNAAWHHSQGTFYRVSEQSKKWVEHDGQHKEQASFVEVMREPHQVVLQDESRGVQVLLRDGVCGVKQATEQTFRQLYQGGFMRVVDCT